MILPLIGPAAADCSPASLDTESLNDAGAAERTLWENSVDLQHW